MRRSTPPLLLMICLSACNDSMAVPEARPYPFLGAAKEVQGVIDASGTAAKFVRDGERLAWAGTIDLPGLGAKYILAATETESNSRGFAVGPDMLEIDLSYLPAMEREAMQKRFGKLSQKLYTQVSTLAVDESVPVTIMFTGDWLEYPPSDSDADLSHTDEAFIERLGEHREAQRQRIATAREPVMEMLAAHGISDVVVYRSTPAISALVPVSFLQTEELNTNEDIIIVHPATPDEGSPLGYAGHSSMSQGVLANGNCTGACDGGAGLLEVGIWEDSKESAGSGFAYGGIATYNNRYWSGMGTAYQIAPSACSMTVPCGTTQACMSSKCASEHTSHVVASIGMEGTYSYPSADTTPNASSVITFSSTGAYSVDIAFANKFTGGMDPQQVSVDWMLDQHQGLFINRSYNQFGDSAADSINYAGRYDGTMFTLANGNTTTITTGCTSLWNGVCVGWYAYNTFNASSTHRRFVGPGATGSTYLNPNANPLFERPHLLGPGGHQGQAGVGGPSGLYMPNIEATSGMRNNHVGTTSSEIYGSSFAAPSVLGASILAFQYEGFFSALGTPAVNKAVLLASTVDSNADGPIGNSNQWSTSGDYEDGAGHIDYNRVKNVLDNNRYASLLLNDASFVSCGAGCREYVVATFNMPASKLLKASLVWNACTNGSVAPFVNNDLDLILVRPSSCNGGGLQQSISGPTSEVEMVHQDCAAIASSTAWTIKIRIKNGAALNSCYSDSTERVGVAWSW